jgi:segregation and condensation protein A
MPADGGAATAAAAADDIEADAFEGEPRRAAAASGAGAPELRLCAWDGPLDLLLELARARKVDLARLSLLDLVERLGVALRVALAGGRAPLSRFGESLVMAAQLAWPRSRLLLPAEEPEAGAQAVPWTDIVALLQACLAVLEKEHGSAPYVRRRSRSGASRTPWRASAGCCPQRREAPRWSGFALECFLPEMADNGPGTALRRRAALASTLMAGLDLERGGRAVLGQDGTFGPVRIAPAPHACSARPGMAPTPKARV